MPKVSRFPSDSYTSSFCASNPLAEKLKSKKNLPEDFTEFHLDFLCVYVFVMFRYVRNLFRKDSYFQKEDFSRTRFDYQFAHQNETASRLLEIQKEMIRFNRLLDKTSNVVEDYIEFVKESMEDLVEDLILPIEDVFPEIQGIVEKYKKKKPSRLNMDAVRRLLGEL
jgi:hypothetical protein